jgi:hypothetical protein
MVVLVVALLLASTSFTLLHWHSGSADRGCQLCHVRHLPSLHCAEAVAYGATLSSERNWDCTPCARVLETCISGESTRAPPAAISFS